MRNDRVLIRLALAIALYVYVLDLVKAIEPVPATNRHEDGRHGINTVDKMVKTGQHGQLLEGTHPLRITSNPSRSLKKIEGGEN